MEEWISFLQGTDLFRKLSEQTLREEVLPLAEFCSFPKGTCLLIPNQQMERFGLLLEGEIHVLHIFQDGRESIVDLCRQGEMFGSDLIGTRTRRSPYHMAAVSTVSMLMFPVSVLLQPGALSEQTRHKMQENLLFLISQNNMRREYRLTILSQRGLRERILTYLVMQTNRKRQSTVQIPFSREKLAEFLCVNRSALSHELSLMQQEGLISFHKNVFTLHTDLTSEETFDEIEEVHDRNAGGIPEGYGTK